MKRKSNESSVSDLIELWLHQSGLTPKYKEFKLLQSWSVLLGPMIANRTEEIRLYEGTLYVQITSASLRSELSFAKAKIIQTLNEQVGEELVKDIVFR